MDMNEITENTDRSRWLALYVLCAGVLMIVLDATIVNVALPSIQDDLGFTQSSLAWVVNAYLIAFGGLLLLAGRLGDLIGQRKIFLFGIALFTAASVVCGLSFSEGSADHGAVRAGDRRRDVERRRPGDDRDDVPRSRGNRQRRSASTASWRRPAARSACSPAAILTRPSPGTGSSSSTCRSGIATAIFARRLVEDKPGIGFGEGADFAGAAVLTVGVMVGVYAILGVTEHGWLAFQTLGLLLISMVLVGGFVLRQARIPNPLMPLRLFKSRNVVGANVVMALLVAGMFAMFFLGALYLQRVLEYDPLQVGFAFLPSALVMGALSLRYSEKLIMRFGAKQTLIPAMFLLAGGLLWFSRAPVDGNYFVDVLPGHGPDRHGCRHGFPGADGPLDVRR